METITINTENLDRFISKVKKLRKGVHIEVLQDYVLYSNSELIYTNLDTIISLEQDYDNVENEVLLSIKILDNITKDKSVKSIVIDFDDENVIYKFGNKVTKIKAIDVNEYPKIDTNNLDFDNLINLDIYSIDRIKTLSTVASDDTSRQLLNGVYFESSESEFRITCTDNHMLRSEVLFYAIPGILETNFILHTENIKLIDKNNSYISVCVFDDTKYIRVFDTDTGIKYTFREILGNYPKYKQVIPELINNNHYTISYKKEYLLEKIKYLQRFSDKNYKLLFKYKIGDNCMELSVVDDSGNNRIETREEVSCEIFNYENSMDNEFAVNIDYLIKIIGTLPEDNVEFSVVNNHSAIVLNHSTYSDTVIMPIRLRYNE